jgi:two-component system response regulator YesN
MKIEIVVPDPPHDFAGIITQLLSGKSLSLQEAARIQKMTPETFSRHFKKYHGMTFRQAKSFYQIERAAQILLSDSRRSIKEISVLAGYADELTFGRAFKRQKGMCATIFRQVHSQIRT